MIRSKRQMSFIQKVWKLMAPFHTDFYRIFLVTTLFEIVRMGGPFLFGKTLDLLIKTKGLLTFEAAFAVIAGLAAVRVLSLIIDYSTDLLIFGSLMRAEGYISTKTFNKLLELSLDYHEKVSTGRKISIINKGTDKLNQLVSDFLFEFQPIVLQLLVTSILMFVTSWRIGLIFSLSVIPFILLTIKINQASFKLRTKRHDAYETSSSEVGDTMTNITVVKAFAQENREDRAFSSIWDLIYHIGVKEFRKRTISGFGRSLVVEIFYVTLLVLGIVEIHSGALTIGSLVFLINLIERAYSNIYRIGRIYQRVADATDPVDRITNLLNETPSVKNEPNPVFPKDLSGQITFDAVTFGYGKKVVLQDVSFEIPAGSFTALVGKSGSGKSTIAKLLSRYYDPGMGRIIVDNKYDLKTLDLDTYRKNTAVVFQDSPVPDRKIWEVISYAAGKKNFAQVKEQVFQAARLAHADEFIMELEDGYQTLVGERGVKLSGGQRQRIAIARALFAQPKILIMDEPTSHLDTVSETMIQKALLEISSKRSMTKIIIAHRLSTVQNADQILVMEGGKLVESGTHSKLLSQNGYYAKIVHQSELKS